MCLYQDRFPFTVSLILYKVDFQQVPEDRFPANSGRGVPIVTSLLFKLHSLLESIDLSLGGSGLCHDCFMSILAIGLLLLSVIPIFITNEVLY